MEGGPGTLRHARRYVARNNAYRICVSVCMHRWIKGEDASLSMNSARVEPQTCKPADQSRNLFPITRPRERPGYHHGYVSRCTVYSPSPLCGRTWKPVHELTRAKLPQLRTSSASTFRRLSSRTRTRASTAQRRHTTSRPLPPRRRPRKGETAMPFSTTRRTRRPRRRSARRCARSTTPSPSPRGPSA